MIFLDWHQTSQALNQFNSLLQAGALDAATGDDIANITRGTGLSSSMVQAAINANKAKNVQTNATTFDDGTNQGFVVYNSKTGEIISKQNVATSKPKETSGGSSVKLGSQEGQATAISEMHNALSSAANSYGDVDPATWAKLKAEWQAKTGLSVSIFNKEFREFADQNRGDYPKSYGLTEWNGNI